MHIRSRTRSIVLCALCLALMSVGAFITIPVPLGLTPFTLTTLFLFFSLIVLSPSEGIIVVLGYLVLGSIGFPIFSGMTGGIAKFVGPTGGYLIGYLLASLAVGGIKVLLNARGLHLRGVKSRLALDIGLCIIVYLFVFTLGTVWYGFNMGIDMVAACVACVLPFAITEPIKIVAAIVCAQPVRIALGLNTIPKATNTLLAAKKTDE